MCSSELPPYILQELPDLTESINYPIKNVQRIKYSCFDVSKSLIAFGATSGGIYIFNRIPCEFVQLIPNKDGTITKLAISANEKHIAFANGRGLVVVTELAQSLSGSHSSITSKEHQNNEVTALVWGGNILFSGDDVGKISILQLPGFIAKTMFQSSSLTIMSLDSRICQIDVKECMLLVSTLSRCYICDTTQEQYRQIGQKLRDGEFGACFLNRERPQENGTTETVDFTEAKQFNKVDEEEKFAIGKNLENVLIYCARPSSRLWEASIDGTVKRTHQFKDVLAKGPMKMITAEAYNSENFQIGEMPEYVDDGQSKINFSKIYNINGAIYSFKRDALYFLDIKDETNSLWFDTYKDIVDSKIYHDNLYLWLSNGSFVSLKFMRIEKFLMKCFIDEKYILCAELCALFSTYLLGQNLSPKLHMLAGLKGKIANEKVLEKIESVLKKFDSLKTMDATQMKSGIYVLDNTFKAQTSLDENTENLKHSEDSKFGTLSPEALQALKDLSVSVTYKFSSSKKLLKEKWDGFEGKMKHLNADKQAVPEVLPKIENKTKTLDVKNENVKEVAPLKIPWEETIEDIPILLDNTDIVYKESSQKAIEVDITSLEDVRVCRSLYQHFRLSLVCKDTEDSNIISIIEDYACDIIKIYQLMILLQRYCVSVGAIEESKFVPNQVFLSYLNLSSRKEELLDEIIQNEELCKYFVDSCISVNIKLSNLSCECGFPLPYNKTNQSPVFADLIDEFIEKQWASHTRDQCYEICKKMPYLWRKIIYLRRNEDLMNILRILLQMLDETLLHTFLPQFTLITWDRAIQLYAILHTNVCLNCNKTFEHISVKDTLSWDALGALMIKSIGGKNSIKVMEKHASLIDAGEISIKFYHACLMVSMFEKYDAAITNKLADVIYTCYGFQDSREEICNLLRSTLNGDIKNTALPIVVASKTVFWGLTPITKTETVSDDEGNEYEVHVIQDITLESIIAKLPKICNGATDCTLCGLPLQNKVLIKDAGLWVFHCGHTFHGACLNLIQNKLCPSCSAKS